MFTSALNGFVGFSTASKTVLQRSSTLFSHVGWVILDYDFKFTARILAYQLKLYKPNPNHDMLQCQLMLKEDQDALWPSSVYLIYTFIVNGVPEHNFVVRQVCAAGRLSLQWYVCRRHEQTILRNTRPSSRVCTHASVTSTTAAPTQTRATSTLPRVISPIRSVNDALYFSANQKNNR